MARAELIEQRPPTPTGVGVHPRVARSSVQGLTCSSVSCPALTNAEDANELLIHRRLNRLQGRRLYAPRMLAQLRRRGVASMMAVVLILAQPGCRSLQKQSQAPTGHTPPEAPRLVGTVTLVDEPGRFVLIDGGFLPPPSAESTLETFTAGAESGVVKVGADRRRPFVIADIVKGAPRKGDQVFQ